MIVIDLYRAVMSTLGFSSSSSSSKLAATGTSEPSRTHDVSQSGSDGNPAVKDSDVPERILMFRTISLILSQLKNRQLPYIQRTLSKDEDKEAKIGDAFAHIAVANHDVVAITTQCTLGTLNIVAATEHTSEDWVETSLPDTTPVQNPGRAYHLVSCIFQFVYTKNPQYKERDVGMINDKKFPSMVETTPILLGDQTLAEYLHALLGEW